MPDEKRPLPYSTIRGQERPAPPTAAVEQPHPWMIAFAERIEARIDAGIKASTTVASEVASLHQVVSDMRTEQREHGERLTALEKAPQRTNSGELRRVSDHNMAQDATIATIVTRLATTESKVDGLVTTNAQQIEKLERLISLAVSTSKSFIDSPIGRLLKLVVYTSLFTYAAQRGIQIGHAP